MTDYFALLDQPRLPWLDLEELKNRFHQKTLSAHPDAQTASDSTRETDSSFAIVNEAYQVLQDPKRRLHHLLTLENSAPASAGQTIPRQLEDLFPAVNALTQQAQSLLEKISATSTALSRSLLQPQIRQLREEAEAVAEKLGTISSASLAKLQASNRTWSPSSPEEVTRLSDLYYTFAYLTRWMAQLDEIHFQLSIH